MCLLDSESDTSYEADSPYSIYSIKGSAYASSDSALAETDVSLVASERVEVEQAHSLKEVFRPPGLFRWFGFGLGKSSPRLWFLGRIYVIYV